MALVELNAPYVLTGPDGTRAVFNDQTDPDFVGMITELTGFDSPDVRESAEDLVQMDGGIHGDFHYGRRPIVMTGIVLNPSSPAERNERLAKISRASDAMRGDAVLQWTPTEFTGPTERMIWVRRQQPLRFSGAWQKQFQLALVAADPRIYSSELMSDTVLAQTASGVSGRSYSKTYPFSYGITTPNGQLVVTNEGDTDTWPILTITGPGSNPTILNLTNDGALNFNYTLGDGETLVVDTLNRTVMLNGSSSRYSAVDFDTSTWFPLVPGDNDIRVAFTTFSAPAGVTVQWRSAWI